jgi:hypothetical protein
VTFFFCGTEVWTQAFTFSKQALYCLGHTSSPFCSGCLGDGGLRNYVPRLALNLCSPDLSLSSRGDYRYKPLVPGLIFHLTESWLSFFFINSDLDHSFVNLWGIYMFVYFPVFTITKNVTSLLYKSLYTYVTLFVEWLSRRRIAGSKGRDL